MKELIILFCILSAIAVIYAYVLLQISRSGGDYDKHYRDELKRLYDNEDNKIK